MSAAGGVSSNYADLIALGTRQTFAGAEFTVPQGDNGYDASDVLAFMKQSGDSECVPSSPFHDCEGQNTDVSVQARQRCRDPVCLLASFPIRQRHMGGLPPRALAPLPIVECVHKGLRCS